MKLNIVWYKIAGSTAPATFVFPHRKLMEYPLSRSKQSLFSKETKQQLQPMLEPITFRTETQLLHCKTYEDWVKCVSRSIGFNSYEQQPWTQPSHYRLPDKETKLQFKEVHIYVARFLRWVENLLLRTFRNRIHHVLDNSKRAKKIDKSKILDSELLQDWDVTTSRKQCSISKG